MMLIRRYEIDPQYKATNWTRRGPILERRRQEGSYKGRGAAAAWAASAFGGPEHKITHMGRCFHMFDHHGQYGEASQSTQEYIQCFPLSSYLHLCPMKGLRPTRMQPGCSPVILSARAKGQGNHPFRCYVAITAASTRRSWWQQVAHHRCCRVECSWQFYRDCSVRRQPSRHKLR